MSNVIYDARVHARASSTDRFKNASIGTEPSEISLSLLARPRDASLRPAKRLRRWAAEQLAASASCSIDIPAPADQRSIGCSSDMADTISTRNGKSQRKIFPVEISMPAAVLLEYGMSKMTDEDAPQIYLADWLSLWELGPTEAAEIAGCGQSYISNIMSGRKTNINVLYLLRLSEKMGVNVNDFYRPLPSKSQLAALKNLSPRAQAAVLDRQRQKA